jgi:hypothetical protein
MTRSLLMLLLGVIFLLPACSQQRGRGGDGDDDDDDDSAGDSAGPPVTVFDLLFVVDNSNSMDRLQGDLAEAFPGAISELAAEGLDFQLAVTTTDMSNGGNGNQGSLRSSDPIGASGCGGFEVVTADDGSLASLVDVGVMGSGDEQGTYAAAIALCKAQSEAWWDALTSLPDDSPTKVICSQVPSDDRLCNAGFLRDGSTVVVSIFSDEGDDSARLEVLPPPQWLSDCVQEHNDDPFFGETDCRMEWWAGFFAGLDNSVSFINFGPTYQFESEATLICGKEAGHVFVPGPCNSFGSTSASIDFLQRSTCGNHGAFFPVEETTVMDDSTTCEVVNFSQLSTAYSETVKAISAAGASGN